MTLILLSFFCGALAVVAALFGCVAYHMVGDVLDADEKIAELESQLAEERRRQFSVGRVHRVLPGGKS